jgi:hypothetical protein
MPLPSEKSSAMDFPQPADAVKGKTQYEITNYVLVYMY